MEPIMRRAILRVRIWNEIRSLADLPTETLACVLDEAFDLPVEDRCEEPLAAGTPQEVHGSQLLAGSGDGDRHQQPTNVTPKTQEDPIRLTAHAARRILTEAGKRRWASPKSTAALTALQEGTSDLGLSERNALAYLLGRMQAPYRHCRKMWPCLRG